MSIVGAKRLSEKLAGVRCMTLADGKEEYSAKSCLAQTMAKREKCVLTIR